MKEFLYLKPTPKLVEYNVPQYPPYYFIYTGETPEKPQRQFVLNDTAFLLINLLDGTKTYESILKILSDKFNESTDQIKSKIDPFFKKLIEEYDYVLKKQNDPTEYKINIRMFHNIYPTAVSLEITDRCNMKCRHCYGDYESENTTNMPLEKVFFILESLKDIGLHVLEITGGDPSVYPNIDKVINKAEELDIASIMFLTNGAYLPGKLLKALTNVKKKAFVQVDLHSLNNEYFDWFTGTQGNLDKVKNNIDRLVANGIRVRVAAIFTPGNVHEMIQIADWAHSHGALLYTPSVVTAMGRASKEDEQSKLFLNDEKMIRQFTKSMKEIKENYPDMILNSPDPPVNCGALSTEISINSKGIVKLCNMDDRTNFNINMGNAGINTVKEIYDENSKFVKTLRKTVLPRMDADTCRECEERFFCSHCLLRGFISARKLKEKCKWYETLDTIIKERFPID